MKTDKWYDTIEDDDTIVAHTSISPDALASYARMMGINNYQYSYNPPVNPGNGTPTSVNTLTSSDAEFENAMCNVTRDIMIHLMERNPDFVNKLIARQLNDTLSQRAATIMPHTVPGGSALYPPPDPHDEPFTFKKQKLSNDNFNFWWDYEDGEVVVYGESNSVEGEVYRVSFDDEDERVSAEEEAEALIRKLFNNEVDINDLISYEEVKSNELTKGLVAWWGMDEESGTRVDSHGSTDTTCSTYTSMKVLQSRGQDTLTGAMAIPSSLLKQLHTSIPTGGNKFSIVSTGVGAGKSMLTNGVIKMVTS